MHAMTEIRTTASFLRLTLVAALALPLAACGPEKNYYNRSVDSIHQPVVSYSTFLYDVRADGASLSRAERERLNGWLNSLNVGYGDSIAIASAGADVSPALQQQIADVIGTRGMMIGLDESNLAGAAPAGSVRLIMRRSSASVPGCPDWKTTQESDMVHATHSNFGCAANSNLAAMIANPEDLVRGQSTDSDLRTATSNRAIETYRTKAPTGSGGLQNLGK
jgi:pilus assembly protein CpaD